MTTLAEQVGQLLIKQQRMLATAESCTGGWVAKTITDIAGSSQWFDCGFITYSNLAKQEMLAVSPQTLAQHGAVSEATAKEMARGALQHSRAQISVAITGIAGPGGATPEKPVGTVCFAWALLGGEAQTATAHFGGDREQVRWQAVEYALRGILARFDIAHG